MDGMITNFNNYATKQIEKVCTLDEEFKRNIELLDQYDFSEFLKDGMDLWHIREAIEEKYDKEFWDKYQMYVFDCLSGEDTCDYFASRYNVRFQEFVSWVVRYEDRIDKKVERRPENNT